MALSPSVRINVSGARGMSHADVARATGAYGTMPTDTDQEVLDRMVGDIAAATIATSNLYEDTTAGLAATSDGDYFSVPDDDDDFVILYQNDGGSAVEINRYPAKSAVIFNDAAGTQGVVQDLAPRASIMASMNGIASGSTSDQSTALNALFATCALLGLTAVIDVPAVHAESHLTAACDIHFNAGCWIINAMTTAGSDDYLIDITDDDVTISATQFGKAGTKALSEDRRRWGFRVRGYRQNVSIQNIWAINMSKSYATSSETVWANIAFGVNTPTNLTIEGGGCVFEGAALTGAATTSADFLGYCDGATVRGATYRNVSGAVQWWGGNAASAGVGDDGLPRKCRKILISSCACDYAVSGGFWGSCGTEVLVIGCRAREAQDVAFDAEGCTNTDFVGCSSHNAKNGGFATFFQCNGVAFKSCTSSSDVNTIVRLVTINNSTNLLTNRNIGLLNCTLRAYGYLAEVSGIGSTSAINAVKDLAILGCTFENARLFTDGPSAYSQRIIGNTFSYGVASADTRPVFIRLGAFGNDGSNGPRISFRDNVVRSNVSQPAESVAVQVIGNGSNVTSRATCCGNEINGFDIPIATLAQGSSASISQNIVVKDNILSANAIGRINSVFTADNSTDIITATALLRGETGTQVRIANSGGALPSGLSAGTDYWLIRVSQTTFKLATSLANATAGTAINFTDNGTGTHTLYTGRTTGSVLTLDGNYTFDGVAIT